MITTGTTTSGCVRATVVDAFSLNYRVLVAVGRRPNTHKLGLDTVGIEPDKRGFVTVDSLAPNEVNVFTPPGVDRMPLIRWAQRRLGQVRRVA